mmetsp:Transcript_8675/g.13731  ORF Transcript_8675/g.13731 Transcript_8675/m.13731 type:complete len:211 (+) Transcript_8675:993-1625(+)
MGPQGSQRLFEIEGGSQRVFDSMEDNHVFREEIRPVPLNKMVSINVERLVTENLPYPAEHLQNMAAMASMTPSANVQTPGDPSLRSRSEAHGDDIKVRKSIEHTVRRSHSQASVDDFEEKMMKILFVRNRYDRKYRSAKSGGYRDLCICVEIGWIQHYGICQFLPVRDWNNHPGTCTIVCEIQILLQSFHDIKQTVGHQDYVNYRNSLGQ